MYSTNMQNLEQNSEIMYINNEINLLQDLLKKTQKNPESISKWVSANWKNTSKEGQRTNFFQTKKLQNIVRNIFQNKIKQIKKNTSLLQNTLAHVKKRK